MKEKNLTERQARYQLQLAQRREVEVTRERDELAWELNREVY